MADLKFNGVMIGSEHPGELGAFYAKALDRDPDMTDGAWSGWSIDGSWFSIVGHDKVTGQASEPERLILNLETPDVQAEFERIRDAGATVVKEPYDLEGMKVATLADPDGNYFQLMSPWEQPAESQA